jgi:hypothetical protein
MLHWRYITANSCNPPGYAAYFNGDNSAGVSLDSNFWNSGVGPCTFPYNDDGAVGTGLPEQFFNCAEVAIVPTEPTASPVPSASPTKSLSSSPTISAVPTTSSAPTGTPVAPTTPAPWSYATACCTQKFDECVSWVGSGEAACQSAAAYGSELFWSVLQEGGCTKRWDICTVGTTGECCNGLTCEAQSGGACGQCVVAGPPIGTPTPYPTATPPTGGNGSMCCSNKGTRVCRNPDSFCDATQAQCEGNCNGDYIAA